MTEVLGGHKRINEIIEKYHETARPFNCLLYTSNTKRPAKVKHSSLFFLFFFITLIFFKKSVSFKLLNGWSGKIMKNV